MSSRIQPLPRQLHVQPAVAAATGTLALLAVTASWIVTSVPLSGGPDVPALLLSLLLAISIPVAYRFPLKVSRHTKVYVSSVPYFLLAALVTPALAATAAGVGSLGGEVSMRKQRGTEATDIVTQVGRRVLVVLAGALVAHLGQDTRLRALSLVGAAFVLGMGDIVTFPLVMGPITGERSLRIIVTATRQAYVIEGVQYLIGLLGALAISGRFLLVALLGLPTALVYFAFQASLRAQEAQHCAEEAQARAEAAHEERERLLELERQARSEIERLAAERAAILLHITDGIIITNPAGRITFANPTARLIYGIGEGPLDSFDPASDTLTVEGEPYPADDFPLGRALREGQTVMNRRWRICRSDGRDIILQGSATPVRAENGTELGALLMVRDVTQEYAVERQKGEFLSAAAHDLRTPLTTIKGRVQYLQLKADAEGEHEREQRRMMLERIDASTTRMMALITDLLDMANMEIGRPIRLDRAPTDLVSLARDVVKEHEHVGTHTISFSSTVPRLEGRWDARRIERVLANLISNAIKYSPGGGEITVTVATEGSWAVMTVTDRGMGIPARDVSRIFDRFYRGDNITGSMPGTGIGLAAARASTEQHGGTIEVQSKEGEGSIFTVRLPLRMAEDER